jgi:hypothetical protein
MRDYGHRSSKRMHFDSNGKKMKKKRKHHLSNPIASHSEHKASVIVSPISIDQQKSTVLPDLVDKSHLMQKDSQAQSKATGLDPDTPITIGSATIAESGYGSTQAYHVNDEDDSRLESDKILSNAIGTNSPMAADMDANDVHSSGPKELNPDQTAAAPHQSDPISTTVETQNNSVTTEVQRNGLQRQERNGRVMKRRSRPPARTARANNASNPDKIVTRAIGILQWACEQEKETIEQEKNEAIEVFRQKALEADHSAAAHSREVEILRKTNHELQLNLAQSNVKLDKLTKQFAKISLFTKGLNNDLDREKRLFRCAREELAVFREAITGMKSEIASSAAQVSEAQHEMQRIKSNHAREIADYEAKEKFFKLETKALRSQLEDKEALLAKEKETTVALQNTSTEQQELQHHIEALLNANKDHLLDRLGDIVSQDNRNTEGEDEMVKLKSLLQEIRSSHSITPDDMKNVEIALNDLQNKYAPMILS